VFGDPAERNSAGSESARCTTGLRRAGSCQDASFRGPVLQCGRYACTPTGPGPQRPVGHSGQGSRRKTAQTSSVAERLTAVQPTGQGVAERADGARQRAPGRSERGVLRLLAGTHYLVPNRWPLQVRKVLLMSACLSHHSASRVVTRVGQCVSRSDGSKSGDPAIWMPSGRRGATVRALGLGAAILGSGRSGPRGFLRWAPPLSRALSLPGASILGAPRRPMARRSGPGVTWRRPWACAVAAAILARSRGRWPGRGAGLTVPGRTPWAPGQGWRLG
jgi:hypothetical protein